MTYPATTPFIVGITGYARSGKDTAAKLLVETLEFKRIGFADALRQDLIALDPIIDPHTGQLLSWAISVCGGDMEKVKTAFPEWRRLQQRYGTDVWRRNDPDIWINRLGAAIRLDYKKHMTPGYVIPDVRFPNERDSVDFDMVIRINREGTKPSNGHDSDTMVDQIDVDYVIDNNGSIEELQRTVLNLVTIKYD